MTYEELRKIRTQIGEAQQALFSASVQDRATKQNRDVYYKIDALLQEAILVMDFVEVIDEKLSYTAEDHTTAIRNYAD